MHSVVDRLVSVLHPERVAVIAGVSERHLRDWRAGFGELPANSEEALRFTDEVVRSMIGRMHPDTVYGWFGGQNPRLGGRAPALVIRYGASDAALRAAVVHAASSFLVD